MTKKARWLEPTGKKERKHLMSIISRLIDYANIKYQGVTYELYSTHTHPFFKGICFASVLYRSSSPPLPSLPPSALRIAIDGEWFYEGSMRCPLSFQIAARGLDGRLYVWILFFPIASRPIPRPGLSTVLSWFFEATQGLISAAWVSARNNSNQEQRVWQKLVLVGHYGIVDLSLFFNFLSLFRGLDTVRRTEVSIEKPLFLKVWSRDRNRFAEMLIFVRDTMLLAPAGSSLEKLGQAMGLPKITLPEEYTKADMNKLMGEQPDVFTVYAARDAELTLLWSELMSDAPIPPPTLGGIGATKLREGICVYNGWKKKEFDYFFRGLEWITQTDTLSPSQRRRIATPRPEAALALTAAHHAYYGGRNEGFLLGIHHAPEGWYDYDLCGAYPAAMCLIPDPDYSVPATTIQGGIGPRMLRYDSLFFGYIRFEFPKPTPFPCLPIRDKEGRGLIYPLKGDTWASAPEIVLALHLGAKIELVQTGFITQSLNRYSLAQGVRGLVQERQKAAELYGKKSPQELAAKEVANSSYGKTAQGLSGKKGYSTRYDRTREIPPSAVTSSVHAAMTTSFVRAIISAAIAQISEAGYRVASVTTDGFLSDAPPEVLEGFDLYGLKNAFAGARDYLVGDPRIWEVKHRAKSLVMLKTRGGFGVGPIDGHELPSAAAGYKPSGTAKERVETLGRPEALAELYLQREGSLIVTFHALPPPSAYVRKKADAVGKDVERRISWEWDYKREIIAPGHDEEIEIDGIVYTHVSADTRPWPSMDDFCKVRSIVADHPMLLKSAEDVSAQDRAIARIRAVRAEGLRAKGGADRSCAISILRAIRAGELSGAWLTQMTRQEIIERISSILKVQLTVEDWKNAGKKTRKKYILEGLEHFLKMLDLMRV